MKHKTAVLGIMIGLAVLSQTACDNKGGNDEFTGIIGNQNTVEQEAGLDREDDRMDEKAPDNLTVTPTSDSDTAEDEKQSEEKDAFSMKQLEELLSVEFVAPEEVIAFLHSHIEEVAQENAAAMVLRLEELQTTYRTILEDKYFPTEIQQGMIDAYLDGKDVTNPDELSEDVIKELVQETINNGYKVEQAEGFFYPIIDYAIYSPFIEYVSPDIQDYLTLMITESGQVAAKDAALTISWEQVLDRALKMEAYLTNHEGSVKADVVKELYDRYEMITFYGLNNTPLFEYGTKKMSVEANSAFKLILEKGGETEFLTKLQGFMDIVEEQGGKLTEAVEQYRKDL